MKANDFGDQRATVLCQKRLPQQAGGRQLRYVIVLPVSASDHESYHGILLRHTFGSMFGGRRCSSATFYEGMDA